METILGLLLILLPAIFKLVEKKLKASGKAVAADQVHEWSEIFGNSEDDVEDAPSAPSAKEQVVTEPVVLRPVIPQPEPVRPKPARPKVNKTSSKVLLQEEALKKKEKIDPKKLVIYSEIMKQKF